MAYAVYPAVIERAGEGYSVFFPDLPGCTSAGSTVLEAALSAEEALSGHIVETVAHGEDIPAPSDLSEIEHDPEVEEVARILVRTNLPGKSVRVNVTMDEGLLDAIDRVAGNRSAFLAEAARDRLLRVREAA